MLAARVGKRFGRLALQAIPLVVGVIVMNFVLIQLLPGDAAEVFADESGAATRETMELLRARFGVDQPAIAQLVAYFGNLLHFNLGFSVRYNAPVADLIVSRLGMTIVLKLSALLLALAVGVAFGVIMAVARARWPDRFLSFVAMFLYSTPGFWIGLMLIVVFSVKLGWLPPEGYRTLGTRLSGIDYVADMARYLVLPAIASATFFIAIFARLVRGAMIEISSQDFVRTAKAKGLSSSAVTIRHVLRNALIPLSTMTGLHVGAMLGGAVVIETIFSWPGLGRLAYEAVLSREYVVLLGILLMSSLLVIVVNIATDTLQVWLDPRVDG